jgi:protein-S-isoprenylcysteine O-methyltransferase Ste14
MKRYLDWAKREYSPRQQVVTLALAGLLIVILLPYLIILGSAKMDAALGLKGFYFGPVNLWLGLALAAAGLGLAWWSIAVQITLGRGTPVPLMPTQQLIASAPFVYCRNPMTLGTILAYGGLCVWLGSWSAVVLVLILASLLLWYIKSFEEKELAARFGQPYLDYKQNTPFILPRLRRRR